MVRIVLWVKYEKSFNTLFLSTNTVKKQISLMPEGVKDQIIAEMKDTSVFDLFSIQLYESFDTSSISHLIVSVCHTIGTSVKEDLSYKLHRL